MQEGVSDLNGIKRIISRNNFGSCKKSRNKGKCDGFNHDAKAHNPLCGDKVHIYLKLEKIKIFQA